MSGLILLVGILIGCLASQPTRPKLYQNSDRWLLYSRYLSRRFRVMASVAACVLVLAIVLLWKHASLPSQWAFVERSCTNYKLEQCWVKTGQIDQSISYDIYWNEHGFWHKGRRTYISTDSWRNP